MSQPPGTPETVVTVLVAENEEPPPGLEPLHDTAEVRVACNAASLREALPGCPVLLVTDFRTQALQQSWDAADSLEWLHAASAGVDAVLFEEVLASEVTVTNARGIFDRSIAEYVLGLILMFAKDSRGNIELQQAHQWRHRDSEKIAGKQVLVVGAGSIGRQIANICTAAGMRCEGVGRTARPPDDDFQSVHASSQLLTILPDFDYVVVAAPLTEDTRGLFGQQAFAAMHPQARFINIGRGQIVRTSALVQALEDGSIAGAGLDVFEQEPLPADHPLWDMRNVFISAHMAGDFHGWREALSEQFLENLSRWRKGEELMNVVKAGRR